MSACLSHETTQIANAFTTNRFQCQSKTYPLYIFHHFHRVLTVVWCSSVSKRPDIDHAKRGNFEERSASACDETSRMQLVISYGGEYWTTEESLPVHDRHCSEEISCVDSCILVKHKRQRDKTKERENLPIEWKWIVRKRQSSERR